MAVVAVVVLEALLQVGALAIWLVNRQAPPTAGMQSTDVLCVGDSFTFGQGAEDRDHSYPAQLQSILEEKSARDWRVVNAGWPGNNSWQVLESLPKLLATHHPKFVCVLVGINDTWSLPRPGVISAKDAEGQGTDGRSFRWELRSLKLGQLLVSMVCNPTPPFASVKDPPPAATAADSVRPKGSYSFGEMVVDERHRDRLHDAEWRAIPGARIIASRRVRDRDRRSGRAAEAAPDRTAP